MPEMKTQYDADILMLKERSWKLDDNYGADEYACRSRIVQFLNSCVSFSPDQNIPTDLFMRFL